MRRIRLVLARRDRGASAVEYGLVVFGIAAAVVLIVYLFGNVVTDMFAESCTTIQDQVQPGVTCAP